MNPLSRATTTLFEAERLRDQKLINGARNRVYYALYQAVMSVFEIKYIKWNDFDTNASRWRHDIIRNNLSHQALRLNRQHQEFIKAAEGKRVTADYTDGFMCTAGEYSKLVAEIRIATEILEKFKQDIAIP
ncbi:MAG: hypothetical protein WCT04_24725 [Planctomycetota bacterium]